MFFFYVFYTQRLGRLVLSCWVASYPARWVDPYPFAGYERTYSLGTIGLIRWVQNKQLESPHEYSEHVVPLIFQRRNSIKPLTCLLLPSNNLRHLYPLY